MQLYFLNKEEEINKEFYSFSDYLQRLVEYHHFNMKYVDAINKEDINDSFYLRFTPSIKDEWLDYSNRIVAMYRWRYNWDLRQFGFAATTYGSNRNSWFSYPQISGVLDVAKRACIKHYPYSIAELPYCALIDDRFQNKCDLLVAYLRVYNEMAKNGELPLLKV